MEGYDVISVADDKKLGTVVREQDDYVVFEHGALRKQHHAVPKTTVEVDADRHEVRTNLSKELVEDSPRVDDSGFDREVLDRYYGEADTAGAAVHERLQSLEDVEGDRPGGIPQESPGLLGERYSSADVPEDR
jgi:hypothetical protein